MLTISSPPGLLASGEFNLKILFDEVLAPQLGVSLMQFAPSINLQADDKKNVWNLAKSPGGNFASLPYDAPKILKATGGIHEIWAAIGSPVVTTAYAKSHLELFVFDSLRHEGVHLIFRVGKENKTYTDFDIAGAVDKMPPGYAALSPAFNGESFASHARETLINLREASVESISI